MLIASIAGSLSMWAIKTVAVTVMEFVAFGGIFLLFGFLLYWLEKRTFSVLSNVFGFKAVVYTTGWVGTTAHELGHIAMCMAFGHRVTEVSLFSPDLESGVMGYVKHAYDPENLYHQTGRLFIGIAPLLTGGALLIGMMFLFFPDYNVDAYNHTTDYGTIDFLKALGIPIWDTISVIFAPHNFITWEFWVFLYFAICVSSHLAPSSTDMEGFWEGIVMIFFLLLPINGIAVAAGWNFTGDILGLMGYVGFVAGFFAIAFSLSLLSFMASYAVAAAWHWKKYAELLNPM